MKDLSCKDKKLFRIVAYSVDAIEAGSSCEFVRVDKLPLIEKALESFKNKKIGFSSELYERLKPLGIKKSWIKQLEEEGIISPILFVKMNVAGREKWVKIWDLETINEGKIRQFIEKKKRGKEERKKKISIALKKVHEKIRRLKKEKEKLLKKLEKHHPFLPYALYLWHLNHYAKTEKYEEKKDELYELKTEVLLKAYKLYPELFKVSFLKRGDRVEFCDDCLERYYEEWKFDYNWLTFGEFLRQQKPCPRCEVEEDYYSLIEFEIDTPLVKFVYHLPYPEVKEIFDKKTLPTAEVGKEEIKFGRGIKKYESLVFPLREVVKKLKTFLRR